MESGRWAILPSSEADALGLPRALLSATEAVACCQDVQEAHVGARFHKIGVSCLMGVAYLTALSAQAESSPDALKAEIQAADAAYFKLLFSDCNPAAMAKMLAPDFEMYHDRGGVVAKTAADFLSFYSKDCASWGKPEAVRVRRVLVPGSLGVYPVPKFGAIEDGLHDFYARVGTGPERTVGRGRFTQLWQQTPDGWRLTRVFSYDHVDAVPDTSHSAIEHPSSPKVSH